MSHTVGDVKAHMSFVQAENIVKIAAHPAAEGEMDRETCPRNFGEGLGQKAKLNTPGQCQFFIHLLIGVQEAAVEVLDFGLFLKQAIVEVFHAQESLYLGQKFHFFQGPQQAGVGSRCHAGLAGPRAGIGHDQENGHESLGQPAPQTLAQGQGTVGREVPLD
jgi:hypothetical protein